MAIARATSPDKPRYLRPNEVMKDLSIGRNTVYEMIASGDLPVVRIGRAVLIPVDALDAYLAARVTPPRDPAATS